MSISQRRGVISLLPKEDANLLKLPNWHLITLLHVDYKIASKVIATRFEKVLDLLISPDQTGFLKGRYIGQNIRLVNDVVEQTKIPNIPGILVQLDFCKAFDTIEWSFIKRSLALFNFGDSIQQWVSTFYNNSESAVLNNGFCTNFFKLSRGVRQGCPLSPYLFIVGAEILACKTRQDKTIKGITVFEKELKLSQLGDDTTLLCNDCNSVNRAFTVLNSFGNLSGLKLNSSKTKALWLASLRNRKDEPFNFKWPKEPLRVLGTYISYDEKQNEEFSFKGKMQKLDIILGIWNSRNLIFFGKCLITKSLGISQLVHPLSTLDFPTQLVQASLHLSGKIEETKSNAKLWSKNITKVVYVLQA